MPENFLVHAFPTNSADASVLDYRFFISGEVRDTVMCVKVFYYFKV